MNIEKLREEAARGFNESRPVDEFIPMEEAFIEGAKWEHERSKWVNVEDGLPPAGETGRTSERVLVLYNCGNIIATRYDHFDKKWRYPTSSIELRWTEIPKL